MTQIRELLIKGRSHNYIQTSLGLNRRTYFRIAKKVFEDDRKRLSKATEEQMMDQLSIHIERANAIYETLESISKDSSIDPEYRIEACNHMHKLSSALVESIAVSPLCQ